MSDRTPFLVAIILAAGFAAVPAAAQVAPLRELCVDRPGKDTPPCIVDKWHAVIEMGAFSYERGPEGASSYAFGAILARFGVTDRAELQVAYTPYSLVKMTDANTGQRQNLDGAGDLTVAVRRNFRTPDGSGVSIAGQVFVTAPTGKGGIGAGAWEGGVIIPVSFELSDALSLTLDPEVDIRGNENGGGHHIAYAGVVSISHYLGSGVTGSAEIWSMIDRDPDQPTTEASFDLMIAWVPVQRNNLQFDLEADLGLTRATPAIVVQAGLALRF